MVDGANALPFAAISTINRRMRREFNAFNLALVLTGIVAVLIAGLMLFPVTAPEIVGDRSDKLYHLVAFAALTFPSALLHRPLSRVVLIFAILFGGLIELIQPYVGRTASWEDLLADILGALLGWFLARAVRALRR